MIWRRIAWDALEFCDEVNDTRVKIGTRRPQEKSWDLADLFDCVRFSNCRSTHFIELYSFSGRSGFFLRGAVDMTRLTINSVYRSRWG